MNIVSGFDQHKRSSFIFGTDLRNEPIEYENHSIREQNLPIIPWSEIIDQKQNGLIQYIQHLGNLKQNWNGYGAIKPLKDTIRNTLGFILHFPISKLLNLNNSNFIPLPHGTIEIELKDSKQLVSIEIGSDEIDYFLETNEGDYKDYDPEFYSGGELPKTLIQILEYTNF